MVKSIARTFLKLLVLTTIATHGQLVLAAMPTANTVSDMIVDDPFGQSDFENAVMPEADYTANVLTTVASTRNPAEPSPDARQIECMAKVIVHEAGNQPRRGQIAVAQVIRTRVRDGRFGDNACSVVQQRGQFFDVDAYQPSRNDDRWAIAVGIAEDTLRGMGKDIVPGALFFRSAGAFMRGRVRVAQVADHVFYR